MLIAVAVLGLAALVAVGRFGQMQAEPVRDTYRPPVPEGELRADDLQGIRFGITPLGYDMAQVDEVMARMARELDARERRCVPASDLPLEHSASADADPAAVDSLTRE